MKPYLKIVYYLTLSIIFSTTVFANFDSENVTLIGRLPYGLCDVAFGSGNYAYIGNGSVLQILNVTDPALPVKVGECITESRVCDIVVSGNFAYIANWSDGFKIIDVSDPAAPSISASIDFEGQCWRISVFGDYAYVGNDTLGLRIIDISTPTSPTLVGTFNPGGTINIEYAQIINNLAYVATNQDGMYIVDISDPGSPVQIGYTPTTYSAGAYDICVVNNIAYYPEAQYGLCIIDVSYPYAPTEIGYFDTPGSVSHIEVIGNYGFVADRDSGLYIIDLTNPTAPVPVASLQTDDDAYSLNIQNDILYLADRDAGFKMMDISDPTSPTLTGFYLTSGSQRDVYVSGNYAYVAENERGLSVIDITNPYAPQEIANLNIEEALSVHGAGDYVYVINNEILIIVDVSDPYSPTQVGFWLGTFQTLYAFSNYVYLGGFPDLSILDVSNPGSPTLIGTLDGLLGSPLGIYVAPGYVYLANRYGGLRIIDVSIPSSPTEVGYYENFDYARSVYVNNNYAYVADRYIGLLKIINISDPYLPVEVASVSIQPLVNDVDGSENFVYTLSDWAGVRVFDVSGPTNPRDVGFFNTGGYDYNIYTDDSFIYVADGGGGFYILQNEAPTRALTLTGANLMPGCYASVDWGDYDSDGDLDILRTGGGPSETLFSLVYRNDGDNTFTIGGNLIPMNNGTGEWGDYDNDGDLDILLTGMSDITPYSLIYRNEGEDLFININANLIPVGNGSAAWGDYDNDGDLDVLLSGFDGTTNHSLLYRNDGNDVFTYIEANLYPLGSGDVDWGDYDNDGDLDILLTGRDASHVYTLVYRNDNNGVFTGLPINLQPMWNNTAEWVDYDNDGDLDIFLTGRGDLANAAYTKLYRNDGNAIFTDIYVNLPPTTEGFGCWGDYDNDGDLDLLLMGWNGTYRDQTKLYRNDGDGVFTDINNDLVEIVVSAAQWGDYDNDGDLDLVMIGYDRDYVLYSNIYRNDGTLFNTAPNAPTNLTSLLENGNLTVSWSPASDNETPTSGLSYNLRIGTTQNGDEIMSSHSDNSNGYRRLSGMGNVQKNTSWTIYDVDPKGTYYWSVQAIDAAYDGSGWASSMITSVIGEDMEIPSEFALNQNYPNPFNPVTHIRYELPTASHVKIELFNIRGEKVRTMLNDHKSAGYHLINFDGRELTSGIYVYTIQAGNFVQSKKMILLQ